jgi:hypothetical protein
VEKQTNGAMSAQFAGVHDHLDAVPAAIVDALPAPATQPAPAPQSPAFIPSARSGAGEHAAPRQAPDQPIRL